MDIWGVPLPQAAGFGGGWLVAVGIGTYVLRLVLNRKLIPEKTHMEIVSRVEVDRDGWRAAYDGMAKVNSDNVLQNAEWSETSRIIRDYIRARDQADAIEAVRRGDQT